MGCAAQAPQPCSHTCGQCCSASCKTHTRNLRHQYPAPAATLRTATRCILNYSQNRGKGKNKPRQAQSCTWGIESPLRTQVSPDHGVSLSGTTVLLALTHLHCCASLAQPQGSAGAAEVPHPTHLHHSRRQRFAPILRGQKPAPSLFCTAANGSELSG